MRASGMPVAVAPAAPVGRSARDARGAVAAIDLECAIEDTPAELNERLADAIESIVESQPSVTAIVAAVPNAWLAGGTEGAAMREAIRQSLTGRPLRLGAVVGRAQALAAWLAGPAGPAGQASAPSLARTVLTCDVHEQVVHLASCELTGSGPRDLTVTLTHYHAGSALPESETFGAAMCAVIGDASAAGGEPAFYPPNGDGIGALYAALNRNLKRLEVALAAARRNPAFLSVPVAGPDDTSPAEWATAGDITRCFQPTADAVRATVDAFIGDKEVTDGMAVVLAGPAAANPLVADLLESEISRRGGGALTFTRASELAAAQGGAAIGSGMVHATLAGPAQMWLPLHRVAYGRLQAVTARLDGAGNGDIRWPENDGDPVMISLAIGETPEFRLDVVYADGARGVRHVVGEAVAGGSYEVGWWPDLTVGGVLALRPDDGSPAVLLAAPSGSGAHVAVVPAQGDRPLGSPDG